MGRDAEERGEKRRERKVEMNSNGLNEHWTASEARKKREIAIRKDERDKVLDELRIIKQYDRIRFHQKHTTPKSWVEVKVMSVSKDGKRIDISGVLPGGGCTTEMGIDLSDVRQVCRWIELRQTLIRDDN